MKRSVIREQQISFSSDEQAEAIQRNMTATNTRTVVITGANSGIGFETALHFARQGARVVMACRSMDKAQQAEQRIHTAVPGANTVIIPLDLSELDAVREFARRFVAEVSTVDVLVNNAGILAIPLTRNSAGHELQFATNYLGPFALTGLLLPHFRPGSPGRVVNVGSLSNRIATLDIDNLNWEKTPYSEWKGYANSKLAVMSFTLELNRRLQASGSHIIALGAHPGFARTEIHNKSPAMARKSRLGRWYQAKMESFVPSADKAARPIILAAGDATARGGDYYGPGGFLEIAGEPAPATVPRRARDTDLARQLWALSETLSGVPYLSGL